jgi:hypothetical protein
LSPLLGVTRDVAVRYHTVEAEMDETPMATGNLMIALQLSEGGREQETGWQEEAGGVVRGSKVVSAAGFGTFGIMGLDATLSPTSGGYECTIWTKCFPLSAKATEATVTLAEAKAKTEDVWASQIASLALILLQIRDGGSRV